MAITWTYKTGEAERKDFAVYYITDKEAGEDQSFTSAELEVIGLGIEDMPISPNATTEETQDILGNNNFAITAYAETMEVTPLRIGRNGKYAEFIDSCIENRAVLDDLEAWYLCVKRYKTGTGGKCRAWVQKGIVELGDFASGLTGVESTHTVHYVGERILGGWDPSTGSFTADSELDTASLI